MRGTGIIAIVVGCSIAAACARPFDEAIDPAIACGSGPCDGTGDGSTDGAGASSIFVVPASLAELAGPTFFDHPFPSDLRREADGSVRFAGFPNPFEVRIVSGYVDATKGLFSGFSPAAATYLRFGAPLDLATLPLDPPATLASDASVQIIDVDPASPERGARHLAQLRFQGPEGLYIPSGTLAVMPMLGAPLRKNTRYAVVVTDRVRTAGGGPIAPSEDLAEVLGLRPATPRTSGLAGAWAPVVRTLGEAGIAPEHVVHLTTFTTEDPTRETYALADHAMTTPAPVAKNIARKDESAELTVYEGVYGPTPLYQVGKPPFSKPSDGGWIVFEDGVPKQQSSAELRFALAVPDAQRCAPPANGFPIVLYAHGTGGDYRSFVHDGTARALALACVASMGIDQVMQGTRAGAPAANDPNRDSKIQLAFFNFENPLAARTHSRQAAIDVLQQARLFTESKTKIPAAVSKTGVDIAFDGAHVMAFGHSQGGLNVPLFLAASDLARGGVLSGAGGVLGLALLGKTKPIDVAALVRVITRLNDEETGKELDLFHPLVTLAQSLIDVADPINYGPDIARSPRPGHSPKSVYQTEGIAPDGTGDNYTPPKSIEVLAVAIGLPRLSPGVRTIAEGRWAGVGDIRLPAGGLSGNLAEGKATGVLAQFTPSAGKDGHFVVFDVPAAQSQASRFCASLAADPAGRVTAGP